MKNKKILTILIILLITLLIIISSIIWKTKRHTQDFTLSETEIEEANQKERDRALEEKRKFEEEHKNNQSTSEKEINYSNNEMERDEMIDQAKEETIEMVENTSEIINRYYPEEYKEVKAMLEIEMQNNDIMEVYSELSEGRKGKYELILRILEEKELSEDDKNILKDYIENNLLDIELDQDLGIRANNILKDNIYN